MLGKERSRQREAHVEKPLGEQEQCVRAAESSPVRLQVSLPRHGKEFVFYSKNSVEQMENRKQRCDCCTFEKNPLAVLGRLDNTRAGIDTERPCRRPLK